MKFNVGDLIEHSGNYSLYDLRHNSRDMGRVDIIRVKFIETRKRQTARKGGTQNFRPTSFDRGRVFNR